jgi:hypothetical protein
VLAGDLRDGLAVDGSGLGGNARKLAKQQVEKLALVARSQPAELFEKFSGIFAHKDKLSRGPSLASGFQAGAPGLG